MAGSDLYERIYAIVQRIPEGKVTTYGRIAEIAGCGAFYIQTTSVNCLTFVHFIHRQP